MHSGARAPQHLAGGGPTELVQVPSAPCTPWRPTCTVCILETAPGAWSLILSVRALALPAADILIVTAWGCVAVGIEC